MLNGGRIAERASSAQPVSSMSKYTSPAPNSLHVKPEQRLRKSSRDHSKSRQTAKEESKTMEKQKTPRNNGMSTWTPNNKQADEIPKKLSMGNQYRATGPSSRSSKEYKKQGSKKYSRSRQHSADPRMNHSKHRKSENGASSDNSFNFKTSKNEDSTSIYLNLIETRLKSNRQRYEKADNTGTVSEEKMLNSNLEH